MTRELLWFNYRGYHARIVFEKDRLFFVFQKKDTKSNQQNFQHILDEGAIDLTRVIDEKIGFKNPQAGVIIK